MTHDYPDDGHIYVCVRVRDVATVPGMTLSQLSTQRSAQERLKDAQRICISTIENIVVMHDPRFIENPSCIARDADDVVQFLTARSCVSKEKDKRVARRVLTSTATASCFECDKCLNSMDASSMLKMPLIYNSDFIRPPERGTQEDVYLSTAVHAVSAAVEGINSCVFAYGQTGSGKTFTLFGDSTCIRRDSGVVPRTIDDVFQRLEDVKRESQNDRQTEYSYRVQLSFFEIYQNEIYCLFSRKGPLRVSFVRNPDGKEEAMVIPELRWHVLASAEKSYPLVELGLRRRQTGETGMNARSSRSHAILQLRIAQWRTNRITKESIELNATINLVDLAGSERQKTAKTDGKSRDEGIQINQSLATLARVINEISRGSKYVNYRDSLLTMVLKENLGGNSKTFMIATIAPIAFCYQESCATLQYAKDVRKIRNRPMINKTFQTRSNLLELNALLKEENEQLKRHIDDLHNNINANSDDVGAYITENSCQLEKVADMAQGYYAAKMKKESGAVTEAVIVAPAVGAVPLIVTAHRKYSSADEISPSCVVDNSIGVTSLTTNIVQFRLSDLLRGSRRPRVVYTQLELDKDYGIVEFERVSQRSFEQHHWMRYIPPTGTAAAPAGNVDCQFNGLTMCSGDRRQLMHGDVICVYIEGAEGESEQSLLSFHYVDILSLSRRSDVPAGLTKDDLKATLALVDGQSEEVVERLLLEKAKLMEMLQAKERTIEYQCQREAESRSRMASLANCHYREKNGSLSPSPAVPLDCVGINTVAATPLQASAAALAFCRMSVSPSIQTENSKEFQGSNDDGYGGGFSFRAAVARNSTMEDLMRRLAELESGASPEGNHPLPAPMTPSDTMTALSMSKKSEVLEVSESENENEDEDERQGDDEHVGASVGDFTVGGTYNINKTPGVATDPNVVYGESRTITGEEDYAPTADELLLKHCTDSELAQLGKMYFYMATSDGVCERHNAAKRERVLCGRILLLEQTLERLRGELQLMESKLRVANDVNTEHELREVQLEDEKTELSKMLLEVTEENAVLLRDINSLETFLHRTEDALAEASFINEAELEKRLAHMSQEINALKRVACMWKRRSMKRVAFDFGDNKNDKSEEDVLNMNGRVPWDELRLEDTAARAKKLLGERGCTSAAANMIDRFEKETAPEVVIALEAVLTGLENKNLRLIDEIKAQETQFQNYRDLVERLRQEKEQLERDEKKRDKGASTNKEVQKFKSLYAQKCKELMLAEKQYEDAQAKLRMAVQNNTVVKKKSVKGNDLLMKEQRRVIEDSQKECQKLRTALRLKDEELCSVLYLMRSHLADTGGDGFKSDKELRDRIEALLAESMSNCTRSCGFSVFPPDFQFSEEVIALIRVCLRIMMDRLKIELYVLNRQSLHKFGLLVPAVQLRPEAQFHCFMHELRGVVAEIAGKPQRIGGKWSIEESDVLSQLVDHRRRRAGNALNGLLIWFDHWDLSPKTEHVSYVELIRNTERVMQLARIVRQESLVNTNATSSLRHMIPANSGVSDSSYTPKSVVRDNSVLESRRILEKLTAETKCSNLARVVGSDKLASSTELFQRSRTVASTLVSSRRSEVNSSRFVRLTTALTPTRSKAERHPLPSERGQHKGESKFGRRTTALVVPVTENDVAFAASSALVRHGSTFNFNRQLTAMKPFDTEPSKHAVKVTRFARAKTDIPSALTALTHSNHRRSNNTPTPNCTFNVDTDNRMRRQKTKTSSLAQRKNSFCRTGTSQFTRTSTSAVPQLSTRISGRRFSAATLTTLLSAGESVSSPKPSVPFAASPSPFYDPHILKKLKQRSASGGNVMPQEERQIKSTSSRKTRMSIMPPYPSTGAYLQVKNTSDSSLNLISAKVRSTSESSAVVAAPGTPCTSCTSACPPSRKQVESQPIVPKLCFDAISK